MVSSEVFGIDVGRDSLRCLLVSLLGPSGKQVGHHTDEVGGQGRGGQAQGEECRVREMHFELIDARVP